MLPIKKSIADYPCYRISADDTNYFALVMDPTVDDVSFVTVVEVFENGGKTPPNSHAAAYEMFFVLKGEGKAWCDGNEATLKAGDVLVLLPKSEYVVENTGDGKLYCLTTMMPNEGFAELIRAGIPVELDEEDIAVFGGL